MDGKKLAAQPFEVTAIEIEAELVETHAAPMDALPSSRLRFSFLLFLTVMLGIAAGASAAFYLLSGSNQYMQVTSRH